MQITDYITPITGLSYYLVCKDYQGHLGIEAIGTPEMTRRQVVEDVREHIASGRPIVHVKFIEGNDMQDVTAEIIGEALALQAAELRVMASEQQVFLTADEAISLLPEGDHVHNFINNTVNMFIGCDYSRADAEEHIRKAVAREIGGPHCKRMKHALVVWSTETNLSFFATDPDKVEAMERAKMPEAVHAIQHL